VCEQEIVLDSKTNKVWGVLLQDGSYVKADAVVCNADAPWAYNNLLPATPYAKKVDQLEYTASTISFYWYHSPSSSSSSSSPWPSHCYQPNPTKGPGL
jgi:protoporphyrinogen oxidase